MATWLDGKKTILAGLLIAVLGGLGALGIKLPFDVPAEGVVSGALGIVVVICRLFATKPGALAK